MNKVCRDCIHNEVCKFIDRLEAEIEKCTDEIIEIQCKKKQVQNTQYVPYYIPSEKTIIAPYRVWTSPSTDDSDPFYKDIQIFCKNE